MAHAVERSTHLCTCLDIIRAAAKCIICQIIESRVSNACMNIWTVFMRRREALEHHVLLFCGAITCIH